MDARSCRDAARDLQLAKIKHQEPLLEALKTHNKALMDLRTTLDQQLEALMLCKIQNLVVVLPSLLLCGRGVGNSIGYRWLRRSRTWRNSSMSGTSTSNPPVKM